MNTITVYEEIINIKQLTVTAVEIDKEVIVHCHVKKQTPTCPTCRVDAQSLGETSMLRVRDHDLALRPTWLALSIRQCHCAKCGEKNPELLTFLDKNRQTTARYAKSVNMVRLGL